MTPKTVKVRIAVGIDKDGDWEACGNSVLQDQEKENRCSWSRSVTHWIEAEIPIPESQTIDGRVE